MSAARAAYDRYGLESARSIDQLTSIVSAGTGKDIVVRGVNDPDLVMTTALWIEFPDRSLIVLRDQDRPYYKARGLFHELGHIVFQHPACTLLGTSPEVKKYSHPGGQVRGRVLVSEANLPALYGSDRHESEAEAVATLIGRSLLKPSFDADEKIFG